MFYVLKLRFLSTFKTYYFWGSLHILFASCKKQDVTKQLNENSKSDFFLKNRSNSNDEQIVINYLQKLDEINNFTENALSTIGIPYWKNMMTIKDNIINTNKGSSISDSIDLYLIPFVRPSENHVNSILQLAISPSDTTINYISDWQYHDSSNNTLPNTSQTTLLMLLNNAVFGPKLYKITDSTCYISSTQGNNVKYLLLSSQLSSRIGKKINKTSDYYQQIVVTVCTWQYVSNTEGQMVGCDPGDPNCNGYTLEEVCEDIIAWELISTGGGSTGGGGTGGGSTGGGGNNNGTPPTCNGSTTTSKQNTVDPCSSGWATIDDLTPQQVLLMNQLNSISSPGDYFYFDNTLNPNNSLSFSSVADFNSYKLGNQVYHNANINIQPTIIDQNQKIEHARFNLILAGGVEVNCKVEKVGNEWLLRNVTSTEYGLVFSWSWDQSDYTVITSSTEIAITVTGYIKYNIFVEGAGTIFKERQKFLIKINKSTGTITSLSKA